jgi:hypothetical protein
MEIENLAGYLKSLEDRISKLEQLALQQVDVSTTRKTVGMKGAAEMLKLSMARVYVLAGQKQIPCYKLGNKLHFYVDELDELIRSGKKFKTIPLRKIVV